MGLFGGALDLFPPFLRLCHFFLLSSSSPSSLGITTGSLEVTFRSVLDEASEDCSHEPGNFFVGFDVFFPSGTSSDCLEDLLASLKDFSFFLSVKSTLL